MPATSITVTLPYPAAANDLLIAGIATDKVAGTYTVPGGFTLINSYIGAVSVSGAMAYKVAVGGETSITWNYTNLEESSAWVGEYIGLTAVSPLDVSASANSAETTVSSQTTVTTAATSYSDELAVAMFGIDSAQNSPSRSWTNSFGEQSFVGAGATAGLGVATKILSTTGTQETTASWTSTDQAYGVIATFGPAIIYPYLQNVTTNSIEVSWETSSNEKGTVDYGPTDSYGTTTSSDSDLLVTASGYTYHKVTITGLSTGTTYHYRINWNGLKSRDSTFKTAPADGSTFSFITYGDNRANSISTSFYNIHAALCEAMTAHNPQTLVMHVGDYIYGDTDPEWQPQFFLPARNVLKNTVIYGTLGNHEASPATTYDNYFDPPPDATDLYYSFNYGNVHFIDTDGNQSVSSGAQWTWLKADLASDAAQNADWRIMMVHQPAVSYGAHGSDSDLATAITNLFTELGSGKNIDVVFAGHNHFYQRDFKPEGTRGGILHITTGGGGAQLADPTTGPYYETGFKDYEYVLVETSHLTMKATVYDSNNTVRDTFYIPHAGTMSSGANQAFTKNGSSTAISPITITDNNYSPTVTAANDIRIQIPSALNMTWDSSVTTATIGGSGSSKVSTTVSYENSNKAVVLDVTSDFAASDLITVSGLKFNNFTAASSADNLDLIVGGSGAPVSSTDNKTIAIGAPTISSASNQTLAVNSPATAISTITVTDDPTSPTVTAANDIRIQIPSALNMTWDSSVTTATIGGSGSSKVSTTVSYENSNKAVVLDVTSDFAASDLITVSGLKFNNFTAASSGNLQLNVSGSGPITNAADSKTITINNPSRGGGGSSIPIPITKNLTSFGFSQGAGIINGTNITVNVPYGTDITNLVAIFTSDGSSVKINGAAQVSGATPNNFTKPVVYTVMASDNSIQNYTVTVTVDQNSVNLSDTASILKEIQRLQELIANMESQSGQNASQPAGQQTNQFIFTKNLRLGNIDLEVKYLQQYLNANGFMVAQTGAGSPGKETTYFGQLTKKALIKFQEKYADEILTPLGFTKGTGIVGAYTRKKLNGF